MTVRFKSPDAGVVCRVDGNAVDRDVKLKPGSHSVVYERDDYVPQEYEFNVEVGTPRDLPICGAWVETEALKALHDAESAARNGNWLVVDRRLKAAGVVSPDNVERRDRLAETSKKQVVIQKKIRQAMDYYQDMEYYEYVKAYYEAFLLGHVLSDDEKLEVKAKCDEQIARLRKDIDTYDKEVAKGRVGFVRDLNSMKEKRANLTNWRRELTE